MPSPQRRERSKWDGDDQRKDHAQSNQPGRDTEFRQDLPQDVAAADHGGAEITREDPQQPFHIAKQQRAVQAKAFLQSSHLPRTRLSAEHHTGDTARKGIDG